MKVKPNTWEFESVVIVASGHSNNLDKAKRIVRQQLASLRGSGVQQISKPTGKYDFAFCETDSTNADLSDSVDAPAATSPTVDPQQKHIRESKPKFELTSAKINSYETVNLDLESRIEQLKILENEVAGCTKCPELSLCRNNTVFGVGNTQSELCFLGEGPGADEDRQGEPFVGQAGQLLNKIIAACKMSREEVYILNTVKCRPPGNRNPSDSELENCWPYAIQQLEILQPKFICCLGSVAARTLLETRQSIGKMRGQFFKFRDSQVVVTYHPAYLLRNPSAKRQVWDDMKMLLAAMGRNVE